MYPFFSNQISKIRSAWIIKHYFRIVDHLQYQILEVAWFSEIFLKTLSGFQIPFFPHLPLSHLLIQRCTVIAFPPKWLCMPNMSKMAFFLHSCSLCILYVSTSVCQCLCVSFSLFSHSFLPSAAVMARNESTIWLAVFLKGLWGENSIFVVNSKKTTKDLCERSLQKSADNHFLHQSRILTSLLVFGDWWFVNIVQLRWNE